MRPLAILLERRRSSFAIGLARKLVVLTLKGSAPAKLTAAEVTIDGVRNLPFDKRWRLLTGPLLDSG